MMNIPTMRLSDRLKELLMEAEGREVTLDGLRKELQIDPTCDEQGRSSWSTLRSLMSRYAKMKLVTPSGRKDGVYKVVKQVKPVQVVGRKSSPPKTVYFPRDRRTGMEMDFAEDLVLRPGDLILLSGTSNAGKTALALNFLAENLDDHPVIMGNEYCTIDGEARPRIINAVEAMDWVEWADDEGQRFTLLPVMEDYAEHIVKDKINIIDWINLEEHYNISRVMEGIKKELGNGIAIIAIQKAQGALAGRGGQFTKDFADVEMLLDLYGEKETILKLGKVKEARSKVLGRTFAYGIENGVYIKNFREIYRCKYCRGQGFRGTKPCTECYNGYIEGVF